MDVSGSRKSRIDRQINLKADIDSYGSGDVLRYLICLVESPERKLKILVKLENDEKMLDDCGAITQQPDVGSQI